MFGGFYTVRFQLGQASGRGVMYVHDGKMLGGNSAFAHIGTYEEIGKEIAIVINTVRHNPDPNYPAMAGTDDATLFARGRRDGARYLFEGRLRELPDTPFRSVMTPVEEQPLPGAGSAAEGSVVNGLYSLRLRVLDDLGAGLTGVMLLNDGRILGGDAYFYYLGTYTSAGGRWKARLSTRSTLRPKVQIRFLLATRSVSAFPVRMTTRAPGSKQPRSQASAVCD